jgi:hypothetical protein
MVARPCTGLASGVVTPIRRDAVLAAAAERAEGEYRANTQLTDFEAIGEDDLHGTSTAAAEG